MLLFPRVKDERMSELLRITLSGLPPSTNSMYRTGKYGNRYKREAVSMWQEETAEKLREAWNSSRYAGKVEVRIVFMFKGNRRWDIDNRLKSLLDCLEVGGVIADDSQIWGLRARKERGEMDSVEMEIYEYPNMPEKETK